MVTVVPVVEGHGDVAATPVLLRRIAQEALPDQYVDILRPVRVKRHLVVKSDELERYV